MTHHLQSTRLARPCILVIGLALLALAWPAGTLAQADQITVTASDPRANAVLMDAPASISLTFSVPVNADASTVRVVGADGHDLAGTEVTWPAPDTALVRPPDTVPHGTWLVAWDVTARDGDATGRGFRGFTVGADQDVAPLTIPDTGFADTRAVTWVTAAAHAAILLGVVLLVAIWPVATLAPATGEGSLLGVVAIAGAALAGIGTLARLGTLAWSSHAGGWRDRVGAALTGDGGGVLLALLALVAIHALALALARDARDRRARVLPWVTTATLPVLVVHLTHAADEPAGRIPALTVAWIAIVALSLLVGGPVILLAARPTHLGGLVTAIAIALPILAASGAYLLWLFTGSRTALTETAYGTTALVTIALAATLMVVTTVSLRVARAGSLGTLIGPALAGVALVVATGSLMTLDTARAELTRDTTQRIVPISLDGERAQLILAPGAAGVNHVRLELDSASLLRQATATLTVTPASRPELGAATVPLSRVGQTAFEYHGAELAVEGHWELRIEITEPGRAPTGTAVSLTLDAEAARVDLPPVPWRFTDFGGSAGMIAAVIGIAGIAIGVAAGRSPLRRESAGLGVAALALAAILLGQGRLDPILAAGGGGNGAINPDDLGMITRGEAIYTESCLSCHGAGLRGDGPAAAGMQPPPADFAAPHTMVHDEATLIYWLRNGKQATAMPAFGGTLTDQQIADVLSYIAREQRELAPD